MGIAVIGLIVLAVVALLAIPVIVAVVGRSATDDDPNETVNRQEGQARSDADSTERGEEEKDPGGNRA